MNNLVKIAFMFIIFFTVSNVEASCSYEELAAKKDLADNVLFTYDYKIVKTEHNFNSAIFNVTITNLYKDIYVMDNFTNKVYKYNSNNKIPTIAQTKAYDNGLTIKYDIYASSGGCKDELLTSSYVTLPPYNIYYGNKLCSGIENYSLCQKWSNVALEYSDFKNQINSYKKSLEKDNIKEENKPGNKQPTEYIVDQIIEFWGKYYIIILPIIILGSIIIIVRQIKKDSFGF